MSESKTTLKSTPLKSKHEALGAKMVPFAGFEMPVQYTGVNEEHLNVRENLGVFDVSHMGEFFITGPNALDLVQRISSNDASKLVDGKVQYSCMPNDKGGIVDDLLIYRFNEETYLLVVNASNIEKDWNWIEGQNTFGAEMSDQSDDYALLAIQGPKTAEVMQSLTEVNLADMGFYTFKVGKFAGKEDVIISATGYTGAGGFEIYCHSDDAEEIWDAVMKAGSDFGIKPAGLAARDTLRLEMGFALYGNDIDDTTSPIEARLGWITKFNHDFVNREALEKQKEEGVDQKLVGFVLNEKGIARKDYPIEDSEGNVIGRVTSGTMSPSLQKAIGLGYVKNDFISPGSEIFIAVRKKKIPAEVVKYPFLKSL
ncbi:glycine cleavage system aminomethyltransferase GcvT [Halocola ammonii]